MTDIDSKTNLDGPDITGLINDDVIQPFMLDQPDFRGRMVRLGPVMNEILAKHNYPKVIEQLLVEAMTLTTLLGGMLKYKGVFTLQVKGEGAVSALSCDLSNDGVIRSFALFDEEALEPFHPENTPTISTLLKKGYLALTVSPDNPDKKRYQGIVELEGETLRASVQHYFKQSEQIKTGMKFFSRLDGDENWHAAAIMLQSLPFEEDKEHMQGVSNLKSDDWRRVMILLDTATRKEMTDRDLPINDMILRLFHEETVRVFEPIQIRRGCRCSREKVATIIQHNIPEDDLDTYRDENGDIFMVCEFCSERYDFTEAEIATLKNSEV